MLLPTHVHFWSNWVFSGLSKKRPEVALCVIPSLVLVVFSGASRASAVWPSDVDGGGCRPCHFPFMHEPRCTIWSAED